MYKIISRFFIFIIRCYQIFISPWLGNNCRYNLNCSNYTIKKIKNYQLYGLFLGFKRILNCHPWIKN